MDFRATIRRGKLTLVPQDHASVEGGPMAVLARAALEPDVSLANVSFDEEVEADEREVQVEFVANDNEHARRLLKRWARATAHERVWFADEVYEPRSLPPVPREAATSCRCCGLMMRDGSQNFWEMVQSCGFFPPFCFACGATVPQWLTVRRPSSRRLERLAKMRELSESSTADVVDREGD